MFAITRLCWGTFPCKLCSLYWGGQYIGANKIKVPLYSVIHYLVVRDLTEQNKKINCYRLSHYGTLFWNMKLKMFHTCSVICVHSKVNFCASLLPYLYLDTRGKAWFTGLSLRAGGRGFSLAILTWPYLTWYFHRKIEEKKNQKKSLAVSFPIFLWYLPATWNLSDIHFTECIKIVYFFNGCPEN